MRHKKVWFAAVGAAALAASTFAATTADADQMHPVSEQLDVLTHDQQDVDALPAWADPAQLGVDELVVSSSQWLGDAQGASHWVVEDQSGHVCLVSIVAASSLHPIIGSTCTSPDLFAKEALTLQVGSPDAASEATLLPDGYTAAARRSAALRVVGVNLAVSDPYAKGTSPITMTPAQDVPSGATTLELADLASITR